MVHAAPTLYEDVANRLAEMIDHGTLREGDRIPSVRRLHDQWSVSVSTVLAAYRLLEDRGLVEARPQSGYYVKPETRHRLAEPQLAGHKSEPREVDLTSLVMRLTQRAGRLDLVGLGCGSPDESLLPIDALNRTMGRVVRQHPDSHGYSVTPGHPALRRALAARMVDAGCSVGPDDVVVTCGAQEAVALCLQAVAQPGDAVVVESPTYFGLLELLQVQGLRAIEVPSHPRDGIDLARLAKVLSAQRVAACALVSNFTNPLGSLMSDAKKARLVELLAAARVPLIEDDVYGELPFEGPRPKAVKAFDRDGRVLYCASLSKTLSPGLRVGWAAPGRWTQAVNRRKLVGSLGCATLPQLVAAEVLTTGGFDKHLRRLRRAYHEQVGRMSRVVARWFPPDTRVARPRGGQFLWVELPSGVDALALFEAAYDAGVSIAPGPMFSPSGRYRNCVRLNCSVRWTDAVEGAVRQLAELTEVQLGS